jgi:3-phosphoshikimate 1-carboxyvinyltransferase
MRQGCDVRWLDERRLFAAPGRPGGGCTRVEADWSSAAFLLVAGRLAGLEVRLRGLGSAAESLQGDAAIERLLAGLDRTATNELDLTDVPDLIAPLTVAALFAERPTRIRGAAHTRVKESDRVAVLASELSKLGALVREQPDGLDIEPLSGAFIREVELDPASDHRMAMAFGLVSLRAPGVSVRSPECVSKSFPTFWEALAAVRRASPVA